MAAEAIIEAFRKHTLLPLDDCLYAFQATIPHLTRSSLHRCLQRYGISRLPDVEDGKGTKRKFKSYPIGFFHIYIAEVRIEQGKLHMFVAIDRTSKFAFVELHERPTTAVSRDFLLRLIAAVPLPDVLRHPVHNARRRRIGGAIDPGGDCKWRTLPSSCLRMWCARNDVDHRTTKPKHLGPMVGSSA